MNNSATKTNYFDWNQTCVQDAGWFQRDPKSNPLAHYRDSNNTPEWWNKNQISMIWDPITKSYIYHNKNTHLTFDDPDQALFEEDLPVLEIDDEPIDSRLPKYPNITAIYNPNTDHYWYHNSFTRTTHFTLNQALFITQHTENAWVTAQLPTDAPTSNQPPQTALPTANTAKDTLDWDRKFNKAKNEIATAKYGLDGWHQVKDHEVLAYMNRQTTPLNTPYCHQEVGEYEGEEEEEQLPPFQLALDHNHHALMTEEEDVEQRAERMASEVENMLLQGLPGAYDNEQEQHTPNITNSWCGTHIHFPDTTPQFDPVLEHQYYGREAQKRDWANLDYQDFLDGDF